MNDFVRQHYDQLQQLQIPAVLYPSLYDQLQLAYGGIIDDDDNEDDRDADANPDTDTTIPPPHPKSYPNWDATRQFLASFFHAANNEETDSMAVAANAFDRFGCMVVVPHVCCWDMEHPSLGMMHALRRVAAKSSNNKNQNNNHVLKDIWQGLQVAEQQQQQQQYQANPGSEMDHNGHHHELDLAKVTTNDDNPPTDNQIDNVDWWCNRIASHPAIWSRVILYHSRDGTVYAALPVPPFFPQQPQSSALTADGNDDDDTDEGTLLFPDDPDLSGPFPFRYYLPRAGHCGDASSSLSSPMDLSLFYWSPNAIRLARTVERLRPPERFPTMDFVPQYQVADPTMRAIRYVALLGCAAPPTCQAHIQLIHARWVQQLHHVRQLQHQQHPPVRQPAQQEQVTSVVQDPNQDQVVDGLLRVYTDQDDPLLLGHAEAGLDPRFYQLVHDPQDADILFSFQSLFAPGTTLQQLVHERCKQHQQQQRNHDNKNTARRRPFFINQFPYEGAMVQKDHLCREILRQHGLPRPDWSCEAYDLDVHLAPFVAAATMTSSLVGCNGKNNHEIDTHINGSSISTTTIPSPTATTWIVKPARGTQSKGHVVTQSVAQIMRMLDAGGGTRVVQRYISNPVCYQGHKVDCRCIVLMVPPPPPRSTTATTTSTNIIRPQLFMHNRVYFRIAHKQHVIATAADRMDHESVLTATHLLSDQQRSSDMNNSKDYTIRLLPLDQKTIAQLEQEYAGDFDWDGFILPAIHTMICELFNGMTLAFPAMMAQSHCRAVYGLDIMFDQQEEEKQQDVDDATATAAAARNITTTTTTTTTSSSSFQVRKGRNMITPKLLEVTFCPSNNAACDAYERDEDTYRSYNTDIFNCLFRNIVSHRITQLQ